MSPQKVRQRAEHATGTADEVAELVDRLRVAVARLNRRLRQSTGSGLTPSQMAVLATVERHGPISIGEIAASEGVRPPTMTRIVAALEESGFVEREPDSADKRVSLVKVTAMGAEAIATIRARKSGYLLEQLARLTSGELEDLSRAIGILEELAE